MAIVRDLSCNVPNNAPAIDPHYDKALPTYTLANALSSLASGATTTPVQVNGGSYILDYRATNWNSGTVIFEAITADGTSYATVASLTANGNQGVVLGQNALVRLRGSAATVSGLSVGLT